MADGSSMSDREVEAVARRLKATPRDMLTAEPYTVAKAIVADLDAVRDAHSDEGPLSRDFPHSLPNNPPPRGEDHEAPPSPSFFEPPGEDPERGKTGYILSPRGEDHEAYDAGYMQCRRDVAAALGLHTRTDDPPRVSPSPERDTVSVEDELVRWEAIADKQTRRADEAERDTERLVDQLRRIRLVCEDDDGSIEEIKSILDMAARSPRGEDHEAGIEAVVIQAINDYTPRDRPWREWKECVARRAAILLSRVSPSPERDTERLVEALQQILDMGCSLGREGDLLGEAQKIASKALAEFSAGDTSSERVPLSRDFPDSLPNNPAPERDDEFQYTETKPHPDDPMLSSPERRRDDDDDLIGDIVRFLVDAGYEAAAATVEIEFGCPPSE